MSFEFLDTEPDCWMSRHLKEVATNRGWDPETESLREFCLRTPVNRSPLRRSPQPGRPVERHEFTAEVTATRRYLETTQRREVGIANGNIELSDQDLQDLLDDGEVMEDDVEQFVLDNVSFDEDDDWENDSEWYDEVVDTSYDEGAEYNADDIRSALVDQIIEHLEEM